MGLMQAFSKQPACGSFIKGEWHIVFKHIRRAKCSQFSVYANYYPKIIICISRVTYTELRVLNLKYNNISSIESISFLDMNSLKVLYLGNNQITKCQALNKSKWGSIEKIDLVENPLVKIEISRLQTDFSKLQLWIGNFLNFKSSEQVNFLARLNYDKITLRKHNQMIIYQQKVVNCLRRKNRTINIV